MDVSLCRKERLLEGGMNYLLRNLHYKMFKKAQHVLEKGRKPIPAQPAEWNCQAWDSSALRTSTRYSASAALHTVCCLWPEAPEPQEHLTEVTYWVLTSILHIWKGKYLALREWDTWMLVYWQTIFIFNRNILLIRHGANPEVPTWGAPLR